MLLLTPGITETHLQDLYADEYIQRVSQDHFPAAPIRNPLVQYLSCFADGRFIGAFMAVRITPTEFDMHSLLKREAVEHSRELGFMCMDWAFSDCAVQRLTAPVIRKFGTVINYCLRLGFTIEGVKRNGCYINGEPQHVVQMGLLRSEYEQMRGAHGCA